MSVGGGRGVMHVWCRQQRSPSTHTRNHHPSPSTSPAPHADEPFFGRGTVYFAQPASERDSVPNTAFALSTQQNAMVVFAFFPTNSLVGAPGQELRYASRCARLAVLPLLLLLLLLLLPPLLLVSACLSTN